MKNLPILLVSLVLTSSACRSKDEKLKLLEDISISALQNSNEALSNSSRMNYSTLSAKLRNAIYGEKVPYWNNKAEKLKDFTKQAIDRLKVISLAEFISNDSIIDLKNRFLNNAKLLDSSIEEEFKKQFDSFSKMSTLTLSARFITEKTKMDILYLESILSRYFNEQLDLMERDYTVISSLISQNTTHLKSGETLEVSAGVGSYTLAANPRFIINGNIINPDKEARATYKLKASGRGKQSFPVKILYTSAEGLQKSHDFTIEYFVDE